MSDSPSLPTAFGIEAVDWSQRGEDSLTVQVTGRWRRRRPRSPGQPLLVLEAEGRRHRFPAMPEPPGITGAAPGTWQMSFTIPVELAPGPGTSAWLQIGAVVIPLPVALIPGSEPQTEHEAEEQPQARQPRGPELALEAAQAEVRDVEARVVRLTEELQGLRQELEHAQEVARARDVARRRAEQQAYAESERRQELQEELDRLLEDFGDEAEAQQALSAAEERVRDLEDETERLHHALDEAEQAAAAAEAGRERAERARGAAAARSEPAMGPRGKLGVEHELALRALVELPSVSPPRMRRPYLDTQALALERRLVAAADADRPLRAPVEAVRSEDATRLRNVLRAAREEVTALRSLTEREREMRVQAEVRVASLEERLVDSEARLVEAQRRSQLAFSAIEELREELGLERVAGGPTTALASPPSPSPPPAALADAAPGEGPVVDPHRLDAALSRLREAPVGTEAPSAVSAGADATAAVPWLSRAMRKLADADPVTAGRLAVALLPAQRAIHPHPLRYDLVLGAAHCLQVTVAGPDSPVVARLAEAAREADEVEFSLHGDLAALGRRVASGSVRRRIGGGHGRIRGDRVAARALLQLAASPLSLRRLLELGVRLEPWVAAALIVRMIEPGWTEGYRFAVAFPADAPAFGGALLHVSDGRPPTALPLLSEALAEAAAVVPAESLTAFLRGEPSAAAAAEPAAVLQRWIERAQSE